MRSQWKKNSQSALTAAYRSTCVLVRTIRAALTTRIEEPPVTPQEQKLAKRIRAQRARLRQLERWAHAPDDRWRRWMEMALRLGREKRKLEQQLRKE